VSSIPNSAMPHAQTVPSSVVAARQEPQASAADRLIARTRSVPTGAWIAGAAALGVAAAAAAATLWDRPQPKKRRPAARRPRGKATV
jgi:hypothetical protein